MSGETVDLAIRALRLSALSAANASSLGGLNEPTVKAMFRRLDNDLERIAELHEAEVAAGAEIQKYDDTLVPFVALMRAELHANSDKGDRPGWLAMDTNTALFEIYYHMAKLTYAIRKEDAAGAREFAADVANMCMMLLDTTGLLGVPK